MKNLFVLLFLFPLYATSQIKIAWQSVDSVFSPLPVSMHVYFASQWNDTTPFRAFYVEVDLHDKKLDFTTDTTLNRRLTPSRFYEKNDKPLLVVNGTFFSFETNRNLNVVVKDGKMVSYNQQNIPGRGKDTLTYRHPFASALGITKKRKADVAWLITDSSEKYAYASQRPLTMLKDSVPYHDGRYFVHAIRPVASSSASPSFSNWKMQTAIGGGPVLVQNNQVSISNNEEQKFTGKAINDRHPRTAMGYTKDNKLIILVIEGRNKNAVGATLVEEAQILKDLGCVEALNLDGGGSSCLLINGKETIKPSDANGQRPVPAVFMIKKK